MPLDAVSRPVVQFFLHVANGGLGLQAERVSAKVDGPQSLCGRREIEALTERAEFVRSVQGRCELPAGLKVDAAHAKRFLSRFSQFSAAPASSVSRVRVPRFIDSIMLPGSCSPSRNG